MRVLVERIENMDKDGQPRGIRTSTITWGRHQRITFAAGGLLHTWVAPAVPAVFAITYQRDQVNKPKGHTVFYFGESEDLSQHASSIKRRAQESWDGDSADDLFVFVHPMAGSTKLERSRVHEQLVLEYQPSANCALG
jgi:hypothetical protein